MRAPRADRQCAPAFLVSQLATPTLSGGVFGGTVCSPPGADGRPSTSGHTLWIVLILRSFNVTIICRDTPQAPAAAHCRNVTADRPDLDCCFASCSVISARGNSPWRVTSLRILRTDFKNTSCQLFVGEKRTFISSPHRTLEGERNRRHSRSLLDRSPSVARAAMSSCIWLVGVR